MARYCPNGFLLKLLGLAALLSLAKEVAGATQHTVGDSAGWSLGVDYSTWASQNTFTVGDSLLFPYAAGSHSVVQLSEADYKSCSTGNGITTASSGNTVVKLDKAQTYYFACGVLSHCSSGMQLSVTVAAASGIVQSAPKTPPSSPGSSTPSTTSSGSSTPPSTPSAAPGSVKAGGALVAIAMAYVCLAI